MQTDFLKKKYLIAWGLGSFLFTKKGKKIQVFNVIILIYVLFC